MSTVGLVIVIAGALIVYWALGAHNFGGTATPPSSGGGGVV